VKPDAAPAGVKPEAAPAGPGAEATDGPALQGRIEAEVLRLTAARAPGSICPSEVARSIEHATPRWRALMPAVRQAAMRLALAGRVQITRGGEALVIESPAVGTEPVLPGRGPIRIRAHHAPRGERSR
jgi:hypothetical protein